MLVAVCAAGCEPSYYYSPENATVVRGGAPAQVVRIPPEVPQGDVEIASTGIVTMHPPDQPEIRALHVRMIVDNEGDNLPWTVDTREQLLEIANVGQSHPMFARADVHAMPSLSVGRRERRALDLYYPVPHGVTGNSQLPAFDFLWQVNTGDRPVSGRAHVQRYEQVEPMYADMYWGGPYWGGWGPYWWYDPFYPSIYYAPHVAFGFHGDHIHAGNFHGHH
jgi:hypothetical protein